jgi:hypothetical protein
MKLPSIIPYIIGCIAGFLVFSDNFNLSREQIWLIGLACYLLILLAEWSLSKIRQKGKKEGE